MPATRSIIFIIIFLSFSNLTFGQTLEREVDSLYQVSVETQNPAALRNLITKSRQWLDRARVAQNKQHIAKAYLSLSRAHFLLGDESEALKLYKLYMIESNQQTLDSLNTLTSRKMQTYEHEVKALIKIQDDLEVENSELKAEKNDLFSKNTYIYYGLTAMAVLGGLLILFWVKQSMFKRKEQEVLAEKVDQDGHSPFDTDSINNELSGLIEEMGKTNFDSIPELKNHFVLNRPLMKTGGDSLWLWQDDEFTIFAIFSAPLTGTSGFLFNNLVKKCLADLVSEQNLRAPSLILTQLELRLKEHHVEGIPDNGLAIGLASFDIKNAHIDYAAAQMSMFVQKDNEISHFTGDTHPLLSSARQKGYFSTERIELNSPTKFILNTDGMAMQLGGKELKPFGAKSVRSTVEEMINQPISEQASIIERLLTSWKGGLEQTDDILFVGMEF